ncbi:hypothetical protein [Amycolatopsis regifaucium]|uniref:Uncharacterized protein n=1 Tax=Amycolatopsis regifaucium TaxID=546365 RepID=A0A154MX53_9PSEU|nr:hypothetical protein [Amycolatopsis regifaucium]KZB88523.1 hypothetical protein AVL48_00070 [Amycolatopsis regifaucium]OKA07306.1 hypothetical protein ATP06_0215720 [Amycolatopsis regifaucium]SFI49594.1 hypothetical protein SAMN04489731_11113 [Amycolatopsis regifaucium]
MTTGSDDSRLRSAVLARAWEKLPGVEVLSSADGGPLTRTIKKIIDPLVIRTAARPRLGRPVLDSVAAAELTELLLADADRLRATAAWFTHLKRQRRALRITAGNVQDVCFPLAYELATGFGAPGPEAPATAAAALRDLHGEGGAAGVDQLTRYLADPRVSADLTEELRRRWHTVSEAPQDIPALQAFVDGLTDSAWRALAASAAGHALGLALRGPDGVRALAEAVEEISGLPVPDLGLQRGERTEVPPLNRRDETGAELLERSVERRVRATLRRLPADERAPVADLVDDELTRVAAGFGLGLPALAACFAVGVVLAPALRPLDGAAPAGVPEFARQLNAQVAREGYVLHARRALAGATPLTPRPDAELLRDLREFAKQFLSRLWVRLHGFDVRGDLPADAADVRDLVTGVVRSTSMDLRTKVRRALVARLPDLEAVS